AACLECKSCGGKSFCCTRGNDFQCFYSAVREKGTRFMRKSRKSRKKKALEAGYKQMGRDEEREKEAKEWVEALIGDSMNEAKNQEVFEKVERLIQEGIDSGEPVEWTPNLVKRIKQDIV